MFNSIKVRTALATVAISITALGAATGAAASGNASTEVTIKGNGDFYGYVKSSNPDKCAEGRKVTLFEQTGSSQDPKNDIKVGSDTASANGTKYMWSTGNTGAKNGSYYARAGKVTGCKGASSKTVTL